MAIVNAGIDAKLFDYITQSIKETAYYQLLGLELQKIGPGYAEIVVKSAAQHSNPLGLIHGGLIMSLADAAMGNAVRSLGIKGVTADCSVALPGAAKFGELIVARGEVVKPGRNLIFVKASVFAGAKLVGDCKATFYKIGDVEY